MIEAEKFLRCARRFALCLGAISVLGVSACDAPQKEQATRTKWGIEPDPGLKKLSPIVAGLEYRVRVYKMLECLMAKTYTKAQEETVNGNGNPIANQFLDQFREKQEALCELFSETERVTAVVFDQIKRTGDPEGYFSFSIFEPAEDDMDGLYFEEREVGLFESLDSCLRVESIARESVIPTRNCQRWLTFEERYPEVDSK